MADLATLHVEVESDGVVKTSHSLEDFTVKSAAAAKAADKVNASSDKLDRQLGRLVKTLTGLLVANRVIQTYQRLSSVWTDLTSRVALATKSQEEAAEAMERISASADRTYSSLENVAEIFLQNAAAFSDLGYSTKEQLDFVEAMNDALVISGAKGQRAETVINAMSKALMAGALKGQNWNTVLQQGGRVVQALADGLGVSISQLREMGRAGELTSSKVFEALQSQKALLEQESESMPATIADAWQRLDNALLKLIGSFNEGSSASAIFVSMIDSVTQAVKYLKNQLESDTDNWVTNIMRVPAFIAAIVKHYVEAITAMLKIVWTQTGIIVDAIKNFEFSGLGDKLKAETQKIWEESEKNQEAIRTQYQVTTGQIKTATEETLKELPAVIDESLSLTAQILRDYGEEFSAIQMMDAAKIVEDFQKAESELIEFVDKMQQPLFKLKKQMEESMRMEGIPPEDLAQIEADYARLMGRLADLDAKLADDRQILQAKMIADVLAANDEILNSSNSTAEQRAAAYGKVAEAAAQMAIEEERVQLQKDVAIAESAVQAAQMAINAMSAVAAAGVQAANAIMAVLQAGQVAAQGNLDAAIGALDKFNSEADAKAKSIASKIQGMTKGLGGGGRGGRKGGGGGKGRKGGGGGSISKEQREFDSLLEYLKTEEEKIAESYEKRKQLIAANTQFESEQYNLLMAKLDEKYAKELRALEDSKQRERDSLYNGLLTEEEMLLQSYERRRQQILESTAVTLEEKHDLEARLTKQYNDELAQMEQERIATQMSAFEGMFSGLAGIAEAAFGEQSKAYRVMFAISKGFAAAQAALSIATGLAKAQELGFPANLAEMARVVATGGQIVSMINSSNYSGAYDKGGVIPSGKWGIVGERGPEIVNGPAAVIGRQQTGEMLKKASGSDLNISIHNHGEPLDFQVNQLTEKDVEIIATRTVNKQVPGLVSSSIRNPNSDISKSLSSSTTLTRKGR